MQMILKGAMKKGMHRYFVPLPSKQSLGQWTLSPFYRKLREVKDLVKGNRASIFGRWQVNSINLTQSQCSFLSMVKPPRFHSTQFLNRFLEIMESLLFTVLLWAPTPEVPRTSALEGLSIILTPPLIRQFKFHWILCCRVRCLLREIISPAASFRLVLGDH